MIAHLLFFYFVKCDRKIADKLYNALIPKQFLLATSHWETHIDERVQDVKVTNTIFSNVLTKVIFFYYCSQQGFRKYILSKISTSL